MTEGGTIVTVDIGGTWIKVCAVAREELHGLFAHNNRAALDRLAGSAIKVPGPGQDPAWEPMASIHAAIDGLSIQEPVAAIGISTLGIVNDLGSAVTHAVAPKLIGPEWPRRLASLHHCPVTLINDAEAALVGAVQMQYIPADTGRAGLYSIGTGLGLALWQHGRLWRPYGRLALLGGFITPGGRYEYGISASRLAAQHPGHDLRAVLLEPAYGTTRETYFRNLADACLNGAILYGLDLCLIGGGLADAARVAQFDLLGAIKAHFKSIPPELEKFPEVRVLQEGNAAQLIGAAGLAMGNYLAKPLV